MDTSNEESLFVPKYEPVDESDEDDVSSATSSDEDDGDEFEVEMVLSERPNPDNPTQSQYLIKWENYPLDQCTWEPLHNLGEGVLHGWEEAKAEIEAGKREPFDIAIFEDAVRSAHNAELESLSSDRGLDAGAAESGSDEDKDGSNDNSSKKNHGGNTTDPASLGSPNLRLADDQLSHAHEPAKATSLSTSTAKLATQDRLHPRETQHGVLAVPRYQGTATKETRPQAGKNPLPKLVTSKPSADKSRPKSSIPATAATLDPSSSSLRDKFTGKKAIRSRRVPQIVMPGENQHRSRKRLGDKIGDPSQDPKQFPSWRAMKIARKRDIKNGDLAPRDVAAIPAHFLISNDRGKIATLKSKVPSSEASARPMPKEDDFAPPAKKAKKAARKAVRFTDVDGSPLDMDPAVESLQDIMDIDQPLPLGKKLSLSTYQARLRTKAITKPCSFGPDGSAEIQIIFEGVPAVTEPWITTFVNAKSIAFSRECGLGDFVAQRQVLVSTESQVGVMRAASSDVDVQLVHVAANLRQEGTALLFYRSQFAVLVFPSDILAWVDNIGHLPSAESRTTLMYLLFKPAFDAQLLPEPVLLPTPQVSPEQQPDLVKLFKDILCLDSRVLRPRDPAEKRGQVFMLCFSSENQLLCQFLALWLSEISPFTKTGGSCYSTDTIEFIGSVQAGCRIYLYNSPGAWKSFEKELKTLPGGLIFDEILTPRIRRFPKIWPMVDSAKCCTFWCLASGESINPPRFPSGQNSMLAPSQYHFTALFPHGRCFLLTPSFVLSDPAGLCEFLEWFIEWGANPGYMVVTGHDFLHWMHSVIKEQIRQTKQGTKYKSSELFTDKIIEDLEKHKRQLEDRTKALELWHAITEKYGDEQTSESLRHIMCAPQQLHSSDEQSLVNWFLWWSLRNLDRYRRFMVVGSQAQRRGMCSLEFRIPNYPDDMAADPDAEEIETDKVVSVQRDAQIAAWRHVQLGAAAIIQTQNDLVPSTAEPVFSGRILKSDHPKEVTQKYQDLNCELRGSWATVFDTPIAYSDLEMADYFQDPKCAFATFKRWLYTGTNRPFIRSSNTWLGLFYTIDGCLDRSKPPQAHKRRPWIAAIRPFHPHETWKPYTAMELLIWDPLSEHGDIDVPDLSCLLDMQARLVEFVKEEIAHGEVPDYYLKRVWLCNKVDPVIDTQCHPLEVACEQLEVMAKEGRYWLPPFDNILVTRGWVQLSMTHSARRSNKPALSQADLFSRPFTKSPADATLPEQIIFHPLRSQAAEHRARHRKLSRCSNDMYRAAMEARQNDPDCLTARLYYRPTLQWYADLKAEKRDASHVYVGTWDAISPRLRKAGQKPGQKSSSRPASSG